jgi:hypothetical protein
MIDEPAPLDLATMERHLDYLKKLPDDISGKAEEIRRYEEKIALVKLAVVRGRPGALTSLPEFRRETPG